MAVPVQSSYIAVNPSPVNKEQLKVVLDSAPLAPHLWSVRVTPEFLEKYRPLEIEFRGRLAKLVEVKP